MEGKLYKSPNGEHYYLTVNGQIFAEIDGHPLKTINQALSLKNCEAVANGYDLDELTNRAFDYMGYHSTVTPHEEKQFKLGYNIAFREALEILGDKKFSEFLDKEKELGISDIKTIERIQWYYNTYFDKSQQTEWDCIIFVDEKTNKPLLDDEGNLILKLK